MPRIILERERCIGCGSCQAVCPKYFELEEDGKFSVTGAKREGEKDVLETEKAECAEQAAQACPVQCIIIEK